MILPVYLQFDLKGLPANVSEATLLLYAYPPGGAAASVSFTVNLPNTRWVDAADQLTTSMTWATQQQLHVIGYAIPWCNKRPVAYPDHQHL